MPNQWSGPIATQTVTFRGTSQIGVKSTSPNFPGSRALVDAKYALVVSGGVSGNFSCVVAGNIGGTTHLIAGITAVTAAGKYILFPVGYSSNGAVSAIPPVAASIGGGLGDMNRLDGILAPSYVYLIANTGTAGISANCTISAVLHAG